MKIQSPAFKNNQVIPTKYTCDGEGINPPLLFSDVPENTQSFALLVDDPDAPSGTFTHWIVWDISPNTSKVGENSVPNEASQGLSDAGKIGYIGPCPPSGTHRYFFKLHALDTKFNLSGTVKREDFDNAMSGHIISQAQLIGFYSREK